MVALLVLSLSLAGALRLQSSMRQHSDLARERSQAVQQAQGALDAQRVLPETAGLDSTALQEVIVATRATTYRVQHRIAMEDGLKTDHVAVQWLHRSEGAQIVQMVSSVAHLAPVYSALLEVPPQDGVLAMQRVLVSPGRAFPGGRSIVKPTPASRIAWVIDTLTGDIQQRCTVAAATQAQALRFEDLAGCDPFTARMVRGFIRFALSSTPDPLRANDTPLQLSVQVGDQQCESAAVSGDGDRYVAYSCAAALAHAEPTLVPQGWAFGVTPGTFKACRYPSSNGAPRNYLVVRADVSCPSVVTQHNGETIDTVRHQP